ncbi:flagellar biosynthetic protein FliO [Fontimonas sp. SYSU GA230001]|uniref:flagellar biosynthetic protein FliO n=1 Tax=Fontimonas sp. SYSU GA230001 TaxID=3142450 RepID=UPI0032B457C1
MTSLPAAAAAEPAAGAAGSAAGIVGMLGSLMLVLALIFALAWLLRWLQSARLGRGPALQLQAGVQVGAKEKVVLIQVGDQQFLLGVAAGGVNLLHRFDAPVNVEIAPAAESAFAQRLRQALTGKASP